jgi:transcriptional regulator with XRE-family HTH domain
VRRRRRLLGLTQRQLGDFIGIRFQQIHKYETGGNRISAARLWSLAEALDVQVDYFFEGLASNTDSMGDGRHKNDQDEQRVDR